MNLVQLTLLQSGDPDPILINPGQVQAITGYRHNGGLGSYVHMAVTGHKWIVKESPHKIVDLIAGAADGLQPPPPSGRQT